MRCGGAAGRLLAALSVVVALAGAAWALDVPAAPLGRVSDFAGLLAPADRQNLESRLEAIETASSNQFAVVLFRSLEGDDLEGFSIRLADAWKVGHRGRDNGVLLLVFADDRRVRIEVGKGLEGAITDALAGRVIRDVLAPPFRRGDYAGGLLAAAEALDAASRGEFKPLPAQRRGAAPPLAGLAPFLLFVVVWLIAARLNRAAHLGRAGRHGSWWIGPWGGMGGGGFGGGFGGGGGFSGGGGGFGGGGASGRW